jgi:hypothetical protein
MIDRERWASRRANRRAMGGLAKIIVSATMRFEIEAIATRV